MVFLVNGDRVNADNAHKGYINQRSQADRFATLPLRQVFDKYVFKLKTCCDRHRGR